MGPAQTLVLSVSRAGGKASSGLATAVTLFLRLPCSVFSGRVIGVRPALRVHLRLLPEGPSAESLAAVGEEGGLGGILQRYESCIKAGENSSENARRERNSVVSRELIRAFITTGS